MNRVLRDAMKRSQSPLAPAQNLDAVTEAERVIAGMSDADLSGLALRIRQEPQNGFLRFWRGLALAHQHKWPAACDEFLAANDLRCNHWRVGWHLAQAARQAGNLPLLDAACQAVLKVNPGFWYARELPKHARGYYAQNGQDQWIERFFAQHPPRTRRFVEVGAFDGVHYSNVRRLVEQHGWTGISIEPVAKNFARLQRSYQGAPVCCLHLAISDRDGELDMHVSTYPHLPEWGSDVASLNGDDKDRWNRYGAQWTVEKVAVQRLSSLLTEQGVDDFDLLSVDAEGHDVEVLRSLDFARFRPQLIVVEYGRERSVILDFLAQASYAVAHDNGQDVFVTDGTTVNHRQPQAPPTREALVRSSGPQRVPARSILPRLNPHLVALDYLPFQSEVDLETLEPQQLITGARFDLTAKILYARARQRKWDTDWARRVYASHIHAFSGGTFREGDGRKQNLQDYLDTFDELLDSIGTAGFDPDQTLVPIGRRHVLIDGAHRAAACWIHRKPLGVVRFDHPANRYDHAYFHRRGLGQAFADAMALEYCRLCPSTYVVTVFPSAQGRHEDIQNVLRHHGDIVYEKTVELNERGALGLIRQMYAREPWLGNWNNQFAGAQFKARACFARPGPVRVFLFQTERIEKAKAAKAEIRKMFGIENHSVHINDPHAETRLLAGLFFNDNSLHFLNHAHPCFFARFERHFELYRSWQQRLGIDPDDCCVDGSAVLALYGIRDAQDLDVLHLGDLDFSPVRPLVNSHNPDAHHHATTRDDILFNPENHFYYLGHKFASLETIRRLKLKRAEGKDRADVAGIDALLGRTAVTLPAPTPQTRAIPEPPARPHKIVGLVPARNEAARIAFCLRALAQYTDAIVYLDDCSEDRTVEVVESLARECRVERILRKTTWQRDEPGDRNALLQAGRQIGGTHFIVLDADEAFTANCARDNFLRHLVLGLLPGDLLVMNWIQLWRSVAQYRFDDSVWTWNYKGFAFCDDGRCSYESRFIHTPRVPANLSGRKHLVPGYAQGLLHFQFVNWRNLLLKQAWYRCLERIRQPDKAATEINTLYAPSKDEAGLRLRPAPAEWFSGYTFFDPAVVDAPDSWREQQVLAWFSQYGRKFFQDLDIWDFPWGRPEEAAPPAPASTPVAGDDLASRAQRLLAGANQSLQHGDLDAARKALLQALHFAPTDPDLILAAGDLHFLSGDLAQARWEYLRATVLQADSPIAWTKRAASAIRLQRIPEFEESLARALQLDPAHAPAIRLLANLNLEQARYADAAQGFARLLQNNPTDVEALVGIARCFDATGETQAARTTYEEILRLDPSHAAASAALQPSEPAAPNPPAAAPVPPPMALPPPADPVPRVSAIVSTFRSERFLRGCLEDLVTQTLFARGELEIIVVDSASPEKEQTIVEDFQQRYPNIRYLRTDQRETIYTAWNRAVRLARAPYLTNANTDDRHRRDALEILARALDQNPEITVVYADCLVTRTENETFETAHPIRKFQWLDFDRRALVEKGCYLGPQPMWRKEVHDEHGYFREDYVSAGDYEFWLRIARNRTFLHVKETLGLYLESPTSVEHANRDRAARETHEARACYRAALAGSSAPTPPTPQAPTISPPASAELPPVTHLGSLIHATRLQQERKLGEAWTSALASLRERPFHPPAWRLLAEIARDAGDPALARQCVDRLLDLTPSWKPARKLAKLVPAKPRTKPDQHQATANWSPPPASADPRLSVCLIVKNEERFLARCLRSIQDVAAQIVLVDTGSTDRTLEIAREFGAEVHPFQWCDDFSAARNTALEHARGDWVLILDADEELLPDSIEKLRNHLRDGRVMAYRLPLLNQGRERLGPNFVPRLFRNAPGLYFSGRIHESCFPIVNQCCRDWGLENRAGDAQLLHHGYDADVVAGRDKTQRNLRLLEQAAREHPGDPNILMNLGMELARVGRTPEGLEQYRAAWHSLSALSPATILPEFREAFLSRYASQLSAARDWTAIVELCNSPLGRCAPLTATLHFLRGNAYAQLEQLAAAAADHRQCVARRHQPVHFPQAPEVFTALPYQAWALALLQQKRFAEADQVIAEGLQRHPEYQTLQCLRAKSSWQQDQPLPALETLHQVITQNATLRDAWLLGGQIALSHPEFHEFALDWTGEAVKHLPEDGDVLALRAEALLFSGATTDALPVWRQATGTPEHPERLAALILCELCEDQLGQHHLNGNATAVNGAFLRWYQRLAQASVREPLLRIHRRLDRLRSVLPSAARALQAAMSEVVQNTTP